MRYVLAAYLCLVSWSAVAQEQCWPRAFVVNQMAEREGSTWVGAGLTPTGLLELYAAPGGETWAMFLTAPDGRSCLIAAGEGWRTDPPSRGPCGVDKPGCV